MNAKVAIFFVIVAFLYLGLLWFQDAGDIVLRVHVLDVGQGDAILVENPDGETILIDGGGGDYVLSEIGNVLLPWERRIDVMILTHPHADHLSGLLDVLERYEVGVVILNPVCYENQEYDEFLRVIGEIGVEVKVSEEVRFDIRSGVRGPDILTGEFISGECTSIKNINNASVITLLTFGDFEMLLTGDAEEERESEYLRSVFGARVGTVDVLKAGHHCSKTASTDIFLRRIRPKLAICSCGEENKFGHPHEEALQRLDSHDVTVLRTDIEGTITIVSDGITWWVE